MKVVHCLIFIIEVGDLMSNKEKEEKVHRIYEPPMAFNLSGESAIGQQYETKGTCYAGTGPGYCYQGNSPVDQCSVGNGASASQTCRSGSYAAISCRGGSSAFAQNCYIGTRPYHCQVGSRA